MAKMFQVYGIGQALIPVLPPPLPFANPPTSNQTNYEIGQLAYSPAPIPNAFFLYGGGGNWIELATSSGGVLSVTGTANQILASPTTGAVVLSLIGPYTPATYTAHGVLMGEGTSSIVASSAGTSGQVFTSGGASADGAYQNLGTNSGLTAHGVVIAEGTGAFAATAAGTTGQTLMGSTGADPVWTGSPSFSGSVTAGTTITATAGAITATNGNLVLGTAGNKVSIATGSNATVGTSGAMTTGAVTVANSSVTANSKIFAYPAALGTVTVPQAYYISAISPGVNFTITSQDATDTSTWNYWIIN